MILTTSHGRLTAFGDQLIDVHIWPGERLAESRERLDGAAGADGALDGGAPAREPRTHCLAFRSVPRRHHPGEDGVAFPEIAERFPEPRPARAALRRDHRIVEDSPRRLYELVAALDQASDPVEARRELDCLAALLATRLVHEEKRIVSALDALDPPLWDRSPPAFLPTDAVTR